MDAGQAAWATATVRIAVGSVMAGLNSRTPRDKKERPPKRSDLSNTSRREPRQISVQRLLDDEPAQRRPAFELGFILSINGHDPARILDAKPISLEGEPKVA